jgi:hypothetical protein
MERKVKILVVVLVACLAVSLFFNGYQFLKTSKSSTSKTFVYEWAYGTGVVLGQQQITNETLRLELAVEWGEETLDIVATINDDDYGDDSLGLAFDRNGNGVIDIGMSDKPYPLSVYNYTTYHDNEICKDGRIYCGIEIIPSTSTYHSCTFMEGVGYKFNIRIPKSELSNIKADMLYIVFQDTDYHPPSVPDSAFWVFVTFEGWQ